eukprot:13858670-Alexandrium_andersonii.AAC.1
MRKGPRGAGCWASGLERDLFRLGHVPRAHAILVADALVEGVLHALILVHDPIRSGSLPGLCSL